MAGKHQSAEQVRAILAAIESDERRERFEASLRALVGHRQGIGVR